MNEVLVGVFSLGGVVLGALLTLTIEVYKEKRNRKRDENYLAVRVICTFERFFDGCVSVVFDNCEHDEDGQLHTTVSLPKLDLESLDVDWKSIAFTKMYEILNFPFRVETANGTLRDIGEYASDFDEYFQERQYQYSIIALEVDRLTVKYRQEYKMPQKNYSDWNPLIELSNIKREIESKRKNA